MVKDQLTWFRRRMGASTKGYEEGGWVLFNPCTGEFRLTVDGTHQMSRLRLGRDNLPSFFTPNYSENTPPDPSIGPPPGFPKGKNPEPIGACWFVVAAWHTHPGNGNLTPPSEQYPRGDYGPFIDYNIPVIVQYGIDPSDVTSFPKPPRRRR